MERVSAVRVCPLLQVTMMFLVAIILGEGRSLLVLPQARLPTTVIRSCCQHRLISSSVKAHQYSELRADIYSSAKRINKVIVEAFASPEKMNDSEVQRLKAFLEEHVSELNQVNVVTLMHRCSKKRMCLFELCSAEVVLDALDVHSPTGGVLSPQGISNAIYSLQHTADGYPLEQQLVGRLAEQLLSSTGRFDSQALANVFYGLKMFTWTSPASQSLLLALQYNIIRNQLQVSDNITEQFVHRAFLSNLRSEIDDLLGASRRGILVGDGSGEGMHSTTDQSHHWLEADRSMIDGFAMRAAVRMTPQGIGSAFLGLQGLGQWTQLSSNSGSWEHSSRSVDGAVRFMLLFLSQTLSNSHDASTPLDAQALANILLGLKGFRFDRDDALQAVREVARRIELDGVHRVFSSMRGRELSMSVWSMQWMASDERALHSLLSCFNGGLDHLLLHSPTGGEGDRSSLTAVGIRFQTAEELGMCFGGMRRMHSTNKEVRRLLLHVTNMIPRSWMDDCDLPLERTLDDSSRAEPSISAHQLSSAVYGLRNMCDDCWEVRRAVSSLSHLMQQQRRGRGGVGAVRFNGQAIATAVYGLQSMSANSAEVRTLLQVLLDKWDASADDFNGQHIAMLGYGLRSLRLSSYLLPPASGRDPLPAFLVEFSRAIASTKHPLSLGTIASVMYGLQGISSDAHGLRAVVAELSVKLQQLLLRDSSGEVVDPTGQEIAMMGYGMQSMGSQWHRVQLMVELFAEVVDRSTASLSGAELSQVFYGLKSMGGGKPFERSSGTLQRVQQEHMNWDADHGTGLKRRFRLPRALLKLLLALERKLLSRRERLTASMVASAVFGLQGISSDVPTVRRILAVLSDDLRQSSDHLDGKGIGSALFGMQNMTSKSPQVRELLRCLSEVIDRSNATLNAQATGNAFYGLQGMSSDVEETRLVLLSLTKKMRAAPMRGRHSDYMLTGQNIGNALWGLRNMSIPDQQLQETDDTATAAAALRDVLGEESLSHEVLGEESLSHEVLGEESLSHEVLGEESLSHEASSGSSNSVQVAVGEVVQDEVVLAVEALTERIAESSAQMSGQNIGNAFYALHGMSSTHPAVRRLLAALALKLVASTGELSGLDVGMTLYGLRRMDSTLPEVRVVLGALLHKIRTSPVELQLRDLSMAIVGTLSVTPWVRDDYLRVLSSKLPGMTYLGDDDLEPDDDDDK